jgi:hypothetical protein
MGKERYAHGVSVGRPEYMKPPERPRSGRIVKWINVVQEERGNCATIIMR